MNRQTIKKVAPIPGVSILLLLVGLVVVELLCGSWFDPQKRMHTLSILRNTNVEFDVSSLYPSREPLVHYTRDRYGLRGPFADYADIDILTIGGSTTDQRFVGDGQTWQDILQQELLNKGLNLTVANAGVDDQSTYGNIKNFESWFSLVPGLKPRYALFYVGINDLYRNTGDALDSVVLAPSRFSLWRALHRARGLWNRGRKTREAYQALPTEKTGVSALNLRDIPLTTQPLQRSYEFMSPRLGSYRARLTTLVGLCIANKMTAIFVNQPSIRYRRQLSGIAGTAEKFDYDGHPCNGVDYFFMIQRLDSVTAAVCRIENIPYLDIVSKLDLTLEDFYDYSHTTPSGAAKVGAAMASALVASKIFDE